MKDRFEVIVAIRDKELNGEISEIDVISKSEWLDDAQRVALRVKKKVSKQ